MSPVWPVRKKQQKRNGTGEDISGTVRNEYGKKDIFPRKSGRGGASAQPLHRAAGRFSADGRTVTGNESPPAHQTTGSAPG